MRVFGAIFSSIFIQISSLSGGNWDPKKMELSKGQCSSRFRVNSACALQWSKKKWTEGECVKSEELSATGKDRFCDFRKARRCAVTVNRRLKKIVQPLYCRATFGSYQTFTETDSEKCE